MSEGPLDHLAAHAREKHVVVVGGGIAGLVAALECAKVGMRVTVLEQGPRVGGVVRSAEIDGLVLDVGAESYATRGGTVRSLVDELGLSEEVTTPRPAGAWVAGLPGGAAAPLPRGGVLGIPDNPWAPEVRRIIGWRGVWRAYLDRLRPPLTIGHQQSLGQLVRSRMGARVLERLVAPVTSGVYSARPDDIDVDLAAPGLNAALTRTGSLSGAVAELRGGRTAAPGSAVEGLRGGMSTLVDALAERVLQLGGDIRTGTRVRGLDATEKGWAVHVAPHEGDAASAEDGAAPPVDADAVIVAVPEGAARELLAPVAPLLDREAAPSPVVEVVTLVVDSAALDAAPRGSGVLTVPGTGAAKALTHSTAKWEWVARAAGQGRHVLRVSFGAQGEEPATAQLDDAAAASLALTEAARMLGVRLDAAHVRGARRERYAQAQPAATIGRAATTAAARGALSAVAGLGATGAWLAGTGLAQVVPDARAEADRIRSALLWRDAGSGA
ncbi:protoporphyrinogen oxidase [Microbacterium lushaniae]|uniref:Coproporphyrinogen III oxidase n=1 Tax=Microbacterium lushaniae TaxID=2614639 RepID=A0A5J6L707_9MICO|nr:protoporphyrinogen oxidase [Microbacterium lushaniae]QEW04469.1 protoporphyrinogen oxidase [Microbacterium lushaniae]